MSEPGQLRPEPLRLGVIGCASIAWQRVLPAAAAVAGLRLVAVASRDPARAARFARRFSCAAVTGYAGLLERDDLDAVYIPLPTALHAEWADRALRRRLHVLLEKPATTTPAHTARLHGLAAEQRLVLAENIMFLHHPLLRRVDEIVASGVLGELRVFSAAFAFPARPRADIRYDPRLGGGALLDGGVYPLRAALHFLGPELEVAGATLWHDAAGGVDIRGSVLLRRGPGVDALLTFGMDHLYRSRYELWGREGRLAVDSAFTPAPAHQPVIRLEFADRAEELRLPASDQAAATLEAFVGNVTSGVADPAAARASVRIAELLAQVRELACPARSRQLLR